MFDNESASGDFLLRRLRDISCHCRDSLPRARKLTFPVTGSEARHEYPYYHCFRADMLSLTTPTFSFHRLYLAPQRERGSLSYG